MSQSPTNWDARFVALAGHVATWSKDPSTRVGCVIVRPDRTVAAMGFNGFPRGVEDRKSRMIDRALKYPMTVHAEPNALLSAHTRVDGCTAYISPLHPCADCAGLLIQAGIKRIVCETADAERWGESFRIAALMFNEAGVDVVQHATEVA